MIIKYMCLTLAASGSVMLAFKTLAIFIAEALTGSGTSWYVIGLSIVTGASIALFVSVLLDVVRG